MFLRNTETYLQNSTSSHPSSTQSVHCSVYKSYWNSYQCNNKGIILHNCNFLTSFQCPSINIPRQEKRELFQWISCCHQHVSKTKAKWDSSCQGQYECLPHCWPEQPWNNKMKVWSTWLLYLPSISTLRTLTFFLHTVFCVLHDPSHQQWLLP